MHIHNDPARTKHGKVAPRMGALCLTRKVRTAQVAGAEHPAMRSKHDLRVTSDWSAMTRFDSYLQVRLAVSISDNPESHLEHAF